MRQEGDSTVVSEDCGRAEESMGGGWQVSDGVEIPLKVPREIGEGASTPRPGSNGSSASPPPDCCSMTRMDKHMAMVGWPSNNVNLSFRSKTDHHITRFYQI